MDVGDHEYAEGSRAMKEGRYTDAIHFFSKVAFLCPSEPLPYLSRAEAYVCLTDVRSGIANYRKALSLMEDTASAEDLRKRLSQLLDSASLSAFSSGNTSAALKLSEEALAEYPHPLTKLHRCTYLIAAEAYGTAEEILRRILETDPDEVQPEASTLLARLLISTKRDFSGAKALISEMVAQFPNDKTTMQAQQHFTTVFARFKENATRSLSVPALTKAIDAYPDDAALYCTRAIAHCEVGAYTLAVQDLFVCINKSDGAHPEAAAMMSRVLATIGDDLAASEDYASAQHYYTESLKWCGDDPNKDVLLARGDCSTLLGKHAEALADFQRVHALDPLSEGARGRLGQLHDAQGIVLYNERHYAEAEVTFTKAIEFFDQSPEFFYHRALARGMLGKGAMMVRDLISCRDLGTTNPQIIGMVEQFCAESVGSEGHHAREATAEAARLEDGLRRLRDVNEAQRRRAERAQRPAENDSGELVSLRSKGREGLDGGLLTPVSIRTLVRNMQVGQASSVVVHTNAITNQQTINGKDARLVSQSNQQRPHWTVSQKKFESRLDKVKVSKPTEPPPHLYRYTPKNIPTRSCDMERYKRRDDDGVEIAPQAPASAQRKGALAPISRTHAVSLSAEGPVLIARQAPRNETSKEGILSRTPQITK